MRMGEVPGRGKDMSKIKKSVGVLTEQVGLCRERGRGAREFLCLVVAATVGEDPG